MTTVYTQEPGYRIWKTVGGWVVVYIEDAHTYHTVDGGKVHTCRKNAYARAMRLNRRLSHILSKWGRAESSFDNYTVCVSEGYIPGTYEISVQKEALPPHYLHTCASYVELEQEIRELAFPQPITWRRVRPETL